MTVPHRLDNPDLRFREAVAAIDAGDTASLAAMLRRHPGLVHERLHNPGAWLRDAVGRALDGFFKHPYLLWFIAEDPVRQGTLPPNIAAVAQLIVDTARREQVASLQEQLDHALLLVSWSWIAAQCHVQIPLLDVLIDAGATIGKTANSALVNRHVAAARHLIDRGGTLTLAAAVCLDRWDDVPGLLARANAGQKQFAFVLAALNGNADALRYLARSGVDLNAPCPDLYPHGTPLHHAVSSGSLPAVQAMVEAGADLDAVDTAWNGTPLGWAMHYIDEAKGGDPGRDYLEIAKYLQAKAG